MVCHGNSAPRQLIEHGVQQCNSQLRWLREGHTLDALQYPPVQIVEEAGQPSDHDIVVLPPLMQLPQQRFIAQVPQGRQHLRSIDHCIMSAVHCSCSCQDQSGERRAGAVFCSAVNPLDY